MIETLVVGTEDQMRLVSKQLISVLIADEEKHDLIIEILEHKKEHTKLKTSNVNKKPHHRIVGELINKKTNELRHDLLKIKTQIERVKNG